MNNQFLLNIKVKNKNSIESPSMRLDGEFFALLGLAIANFVLEFLIRRFLPVNINDTFIQLSHIFIFFAFPLYLIFGYWKKSFWLSLSLFFVIIPLYLLIEKNIISFYWASLFTLTWPIYYLVFQNEKTKIIDILAGRTNRLANPGLGLLAGLLFSAHLFLIIYLSRTFFPIHPDFEKIYINFFLEINFSLIGMELLFRYLLFYQLVEKYDFSFLLASGISTLLFILPFLTNPSFTQNTAVIVGLFYYGLMQGFFSCWLVYRTKSLLPSIIFSLVLTIFLSFIF